MAKWQADTKGRATYRHTPVPTKKVLQLHQGLSKKKSALLVQLRKKEFELKNFFQRQVRVRRETADRRLHPSEMQEAQGPPKPGIRGPARLI